MMPLRVNTPFLIAGITPFQTAADKSQRKGDQKRKTRTAWGRFQTHGP
jgi:hypothetical protein